MKLAIAEMEKCDGFPKVGAVVTKNGELLSAGYRGESEKRHAERIALEKISSEESQGATLYTTLEPCVEISSNQLTQSCSKLIADSGVSECCIGMYDPNGEIYTDGLKYLKDAGVDTSFFHRKYQREVQAKTFSYDNMNIAYGSGSRKVRVEAGQKPFKVYFSENDERHVDIHWSRLDSPAHKFDLLSGNESVLLAKNASTFADVLDPFAYHDPSHYARIAVGEVAIVMSRSENLVVLFQLMEIMESYIRFRWEVRNP